jgi:hypothetical protein
MRINISQFRLVFMDFREPVDVVKYGTVIGRWIPADRNGTQEKKTSDKEEREHHARESEAL